MILCRTKQVKKLSGIYREGSLGKYKQINVKRDSSMLLWWPENLSAPKAKIYKTLLRHDFDYKVKGGGSITVGDPHFIVKFETSLPKKEQNLWVGTGGCHI